MTPEKVDGSAVQDQINTLGNRMDKGFERLELVISGYEGRLRAMEIAAAGENAVVKNKVDAAWVKIDKLVVDVSAAQKTGDAALETAKELTKVAKWILSIFSAVLVAIIISFATGHAYIGFK